MSGSAAPLVEATATVQAATAALIQRTALISLAGATSAYQPTSYQDAIAMVDLVAPLFDAAALAAADVGDTASYLALNALRAAVVADLLARGAQLPQLITVTTPLPLPSLTLAYELYADATRSDDLIQRADPIAPLFMPTNFQALAS